MHKTQGEGEKIIDEQKQQIEAISSSFKDVIRSLVKYEEIEKHVELMSKNDRKLYDDYKELESKYYNELTQEVPKERGNNQFLKYINGKMGLNKRQSYENNLKNISSRLVINKRKKLGDEYNFKKIIEEWKKWNDDKGDEPNEEEEEIIEISHIGG